MLCASLNLFRAYTEENEEKNKDQNTLHNVILTNNIRLKTLRKKIEVKWCEDAKTKRKK